MEVTGKSSQRNTPATQQTRGIWAKNWELRGEFVFARSYATAYAPYILKSERLGHSGHKSETDV